MNPLVAKLVAVVVFAIVVAVPFVLRPAPPLPLSDAIVIISPHGEAIRHEFGVAFAKWSQANLGREVAIDWRTPGGTSDIVRFLDDQYKAAFRRSPAYDDSFAQAKPPGRKDGEDDTAFAARNDAWKRARTAFTADDATSIGIDLFFGGGEFPHRAQADKGYLVDAGLLKNEPAWFGDGAIPMKLSGETITDAKGRYYGACLSTFGICWHPADVATGGFSAPDGWSWMADPRLIGRTTFADPTKSGVPVTAMERIFQQEMVRAMGGEAVAAKREPTPEELEQGWRSGFALIRRFAANARQVTDGSSKAVRDTARGDALASMCIDFHARAEADYAATESGGEPRLAFIDPPGGTSVSADPIGLLRGAPHKTEAIAFIRFVLSPEGQRLWNYRIGEPGGPVRYALRRAPVRRDVYTPADRAHMSDPALDPFAQALTCTYRPAWTGHLYSLIGPLVKAVLLDPREELKTAWRDIRDAGGAGNVPDAIAAFDRMPFTYSQARAISDRLKKPLEGARLLRSWAEAAAADYIEASRLARAIAVAEHR